MAVPVPISLDMEPVPEGTPPLTGNVTGAVAALFASLLTGTMDISLINGRVGGPSPGENVGPWLPSESRSQGDLNWYYWFNDVYGYQPGQQGCPVGTVAIAGHSSLIPPRWLLCDGRAVLTANYPRLYGAIGNTWGGNSSEFNLPPGGCFYINQQAFSVDSGVPINPGSPGPGEVGQSGGSQTVLIPVSAIPALQIQLPYLFPQIITGDDAAPYIVSSKSTNVLGFPVTDENGNPVGKNQQQIAIMPPFVLANFIIRYL
jgi:microcystin-dependent protein